MDNKELKVGENFPSQIIEAITNASVHVGIFSERYAESEWCLRELVYMLDSGAPIVPVFYHVEPAVLRWTQGRGLYAEALGKLEEKKTRDPETHEEKRRYDPSTIEKWREALSRVSEISGLDLQVTCNGDEGELVRKIVQHVLERIKSMDIGISEFYCSQEYGCPGGLHDWSDGTYSGIRRISLTKNDNSLTSVQLHYGLEGDESVNGKYIRGFRHGNADGSPIEYNLNYPEEFVTKITGYFGTSFITSLTFHTNRRRKLGPCGQKQGTYFKTEVRGKIVGIFGSGAARVDSIGVYMLKSRTSKEREFYRSPSCGGTGGAFWNDGTYSGIRRITVTVNNGNWLTSLQLHYGLEGEESLKDKHFSGLRHGTPNGPRKQYNLNYPEEFVTKISGYFGQYGPFKVLISLTFHTNQRKLGPCGAEVGPSFETEVGGKIVGFFGSSGDLVDSIGVYMLKPRSSEDDLSESESD